MYACVSIYTCVYVCVFVCAQLLSPVRLFVTPWTVAHQAPLSVRFPRRKYRNVLSFLLQGICPTHVSCIGRWICYCWTTREALLPFGGTHVGFSADWTPKSTIAESQRLSETLQILPWLHLCYSTTTVVAGSVQVLNQLLTAVLVGPVQGVSSFLL